MFVEFDLIIIKNDKHIKNDKNLYNIQKEFIELLFFHIKIVILKKYKIFFRYSS